MVAEQNIAYVSNQIRKNQLDTSLDALKALNTGGTWNGNVCTYSVGTVIVNSDGTLTVKKTSTASRLLFYLTENSGSSTPTSGTKYAGCVLSGCPLGGSESTYSQHGEQAQSPWGAVAAEYGNGSTIGTSSLPVFFYIVINESYTTPSEGLTFKPMICTAEAWEISHEFEPYALSNHDLTQLESKDRAALAEEIDAGAKNKFDPTKITELRNLATNSSDYSYVSTTTDTRTLCNFCVFSWNGNTKIDQLTKTDISANGKVVLYFTKTNTFNKISFGHSGQQKDLMIFYDVSALVNGQSYVLSCNVTQYNPSVANFAFSDVMICTKAAFAVSPKFVPYAKSNYSLTQDKLDKCSPTIVPSGDLNDITTNQFAIYSSNVSSLPVSLYCFVRTSVATNNERVQEATVLSDGRTFVRSYNGSWHGWRETTTNQITNWRSDVTFSAANTYQKITSVSVPVGVYMRIDVGQFYSNGIPTGIIISKAADVASIAAGNTYGKAEQAGTGTDYQMASFSTSAYFFNTQTAFTMNIFCRCANASKNTVYVTTEILN